MKSLNGKTHKFKISVKKPTMASIVTQGAFVILAFTWMLAVVKVFLLEGHHSINNEAISFDISEGEYNSNQFFIRSQQEKYPDLSRTEDYALRSFVGRFDNERTVLNEVAKNIIVPTFSEWVFIRASPVYSATGDRAQVISDQPLDQGITPPHITNKKKASPYITKKKVASPPITNLKKASDLMWPPVQQDGTISVSDGVEIMPVIGLKVPRFFMPPPEVDINKVGSKVNGQETIFLMIASYRDPQCRETITTAYNRADYPERLFIGAVDQLVDGDIGCVDLDISCIDDPTQMICKYRDQISVYKMDATYSTGPVTARHIGDRMYRGETFVMQMDAHCQFINHWDTLIINQWTATQNEMAVLSSYLTDLQGSISKEGDSLRDTRPIMCHSDYEGEMPARYLRHLGQPEVKAVIRDMPQLEPFWAAGFSFSRGHFKLRVPYDAYQPMVFQGEEINVGIRGFTHGYDFYAPRDSVVFHEYAEKSKRRKKIPMFWENSDAHKGEGQKSLMRATALIGMAPDIDPSSYDHSEIERYGIGKVRELALFYKLFLIDPVKRKATMLCPFVSTGVMHHEFQKYLRPDHLGIDYSYLEDFNTAAELPLPTEEEQKVADD